MPPSGMTGKPGQQWGVSRGAWKGGWGMERPLMWSTPQLDVGRGQLGWWGVLGGRRVGLT